MSAVLRPSPPIPSDAELALLESDAIAAAWGGDVIALANADPNEVDAVGRRAIWRHGCDAGMTAPPTNVATPSDPHSAEAPTLAELCKIAISTPYGLSEGGVTGEGLLAVFIAGRVSRDAEVAELKAKIAELTAQEQLWARQAERARLDLGGYILQEGQDGGVVPDEILRVDDALRAAPFHRSASSPVEGGN